MKDFDDIFVDEWLEYGISLACKDLPEFHPPIKVTAPTPKLGWEQCRAITLSSKAYAAANLNPATTPLRQAEIEADMRIRARGGLTRIRARDKKDFDDVLLDKWLRHGIGLAFKDLP